MKRNRMVECVCGCGQKMFLFDKWGRLRKYINGHSQRGKSRPWMMGDKNVAKRPKVRKKISENNGMKRPEVRKKQLINLRKAMKRPKIRKKQLINLRKAMKRPEVIAKRLIVFRDPERCRKISETKKQLFREGKLFTEEHLKNHRKAMKKPEIREKISKAQKGKPIPSIQGDKHCNWNNGSSFEPYSPEFNRQLKDFIRQRDEYKCQFPRCGIPENGKAHNVHHIDYIKENSSPENMILLCVMHNTKVNFNREHWTKIFQKKMSEIPVGGLNE